VLQAEERVTLIATLFVPPVVLIIPNYVILGQLKWIDTLAAVIVPTAASAFGASFLCEFSTSMRTRAVNRLTHWHCETNASGALLWPQGGQRTDSEQGGQWTVKIFSSPAVSTVIPSPGRVGADPRPFCERGS
jgi:hypothetical protein